jgi:hypothetical protein
MTMRMRRASLLAMLTAALSSCVTAPRDIDTGHLRHRIVWLAASETTVV